jgi:hypothetical protein
MAETKTGEPGLRREIDGQIAGLFSAADKVLAALTILKKARPTEVKSPARRSREIAPQPAVPAAKVDAAKFRADGKRRGGGREGPEVAASASMSGTTGLVVRLILSATVGARLGLKPKGRAGITMTGSGKIRVYSSNAGVTVGRQGATARLRLELPAARCGVTGKHRSEALIHHFDEQDHLIVILPTWWKTPVPDASLTPAVSTRKASSASSTAPPPVSASPTGADSKVRCQACKRHPATLQCNLCGKPSCDDCWGDHVKSHWAKGEGARPPCRREAHA